jgi:alanine dehydrogenase
VRGGGGWFASKVVSVFPSNTGTGFSSHQGVVLLFEAEHGALCCIADAHAVTAIRTAAASAVATRLLARPEASTLAILGSGDFSSETSLKSAEINWSSMSVPLFRYPGQDAPGGHLCRATDHIRNGLVARRCARRGVRQSPQHCGTPRAGGEQEVSVFVWLQNLKVGTLWAFWQVADPSACVADADVVCTVTSASSPILRGEDLKPGAHINAVGSCFPTQRELDTLAVTRSKLFVDTREACLKEPGCIVTPLKVSTLYVNVRSGSHLFVLLTVFSFQ